MRLADQICTKKKGKTVPTFLKKTYQILQNPQNYSAIRWAPNGIGFIVVDQEQFSKYVLPKFFKHSNYSSFVRQLNMYNFHKIRQGGLQSYFHHELFDKNDKTLISEIKRKPQKKRRKVQQSSQEDKDEQSEPIKFLKTCKNITNSKKQSTKSIQNKKTTGQNTHDVFNSQHDNEVIQYHQPPSQNIFSIEAEDDRISINEEIAQRCHHFQTRQLINPSNNNLMVLNYSRPPSNPSLIL